jgi:hypothetical protein
MIAVLSYFSGAYFPDPNSIAANFLSLCGGWSVEERLLFACLRPEVAFANSSYGGMRWTYCCSNDVWMMLFQPMLLSHHSIDCQSCCSRGFDPGMRISSSKKRAVEEPHHHSGDSSTAGSGPTARGTDTNAVDPA